MTKKLLERPAKEAGWKEALVEVKLPVEVKPSEIPGIWVARSRLGDVVTQGRSEQEALESIIDAVQLVAKWRIDPEWEDGVKVKRTGNKA